MASLFHLLVHLFFACNSILVFGADVVHFEDGYTIKTVIEGHKLNINPYSIFPLPGSSDFLILDSHPGTVYISSSQSSQGSSIKWLAGKRADGYVEGFVDGDLEAARFKKLRSLAVDMKGNIYVADWGNKAIRKISKSGVTTIAGGGHEVHTDGPAQNASLSNSFELAFLPEACALIISDHGTMLLQKIDLKPEDCTGSSQSVKGITSAWVIFLGVACLVSGLFVGFMVRPYVLPQTGNIQSASIQQDMEALPSHFVGSDELSASNVAKPQLLVNQLDDLISLDDGFQLLDTNVKTVEQAVNNSETAIDTSSSTSHGQIDAMIQENFTVFAEKTRERLPQAVSPKSSSCLVRRRSK